MGRRELARLLRQVGGGGSEGLAGRLQSLLLPPHLGQGALAGDGLDAPHARRDAALADYLEQADVAGALHMGAAAELDGVFAAFDPAHAHHPHLGAVFLAEQGQGALAAGRLDGHDLLGHLRVQEYLLVHHVLDGAQLLRRERRGVGEIEAQTASLHQ